MKLKYIIIVWSVYIIGCIAYGMVKYEANKEQSKHLKKIDIRFILDWKEWLVESSHKWKQNFQTNGIL